MGVSKNRDTPKWMVYNMFIMENPIKMDDLGVPLFSETSIFNSRNHQGIVILILFCGLLSKHIFMISSGVSPFPLRCASQIADSENTCSTILLSKDI